MEPTISFEDTNEDPLEPISKRIKIDSDGENDNDDNDSEISVFKFSHPPSGGGGSEFGGRSELSLDNTVSQTFRGKKVARHMCSCIKKGTGG